MSAYTREPEKAVATCPVNCGWTKIYWFDPNKMSPASRAEHGVITHTRRCKKLQSIRGAR